MTTLMSDPHHTKASQEDSDYGSRKLETLTFKFLNLLELNVASVKNKISSYHFLPFVISDILYFTLPGYNLYSLNFKNISQKHKLKKKHFKGQLC